MSAKKFFKYPLILLGVLAALLLGTSLYSNYLYFKGPRHESSIDALRKICDARKNDVAVNQSAPPLTSPIYSDEKIATWLAEAVPNIMTLHHTKIVQELTDGGKYFTADGWCNFIDAMNSSNILDATISRKLQISILEHAQPKVVRSGVVDDVYKWELEVPVTIHFESHDAPPPSDITGEVLLVKVLRSSSQMNSEGIGISQWVTAKAQN